MNRRTLLKGLASLPLLRHLDLSVETSPVETSPKDREPCLSNEAYERILMESGGWCAPMTPVYTLGAATRPVRDALPVLTAPRGGIRFIKPE